MKNQYSDSSGALRGGLTLALDTGSAVTSVALGRGPTVVAERRAGGGRSSARLLALVEELLAESGARPGDLDRVIAARGPGSFTGLRVGLATVLGLHQALGVRATAVGSLEALARAAAVPDDRRPIVALVDALRGEWFARVFRGGASPRPIAEASIVAPERLLETAPCRVTGFDLDRLPAAVAGAPGIELVPAAALAPTLLRIAADESLDWDPAQLVAPLYLRPPAALGL